MPIRDEEYMTQYVYLIQTSEAITNKENVYKIGNTRKLNMTRLSNYKKGYKVIYALEVSNSLLAEQKILEKLKTLFKQRLDYGREYFEGNIEYIKKTFLNIIFEQQFEKNATKSIKKTNEETNNINIYYNFLLECTKESNMHIHTCTLYDKFKNWYKDQNIPNNRNFLTGIKKYKNIDKSVRIGNKISSGIKNLTIT